MARMLRPNRHSAATITTFVSTRPPSPEVVQQQQQQQQQHHHQQRQRHPHERPLPVSNPHPTTGARPLQPQQRSRLSSNNHLVHNSGDRLPVRDSTLHNMTWLAERKAEDAHFVLKYVLRSLATVFSLISVGLLSAALTSAPFGDVWDFWGALIFYIPAWVISILWNLVWMLIMIARKRQIVPGLVVAFDLLIWMYYVFPQVWGWFYFADLVGGSYYYYDNYYDEANYDTNAIAYASGTTGAGSVFAFLATCMHFILFVIACIDEDRRRRRLHQQTTYFAPAATVGAAPVMACNTTHCVDCHQPIELRCKRCSVAHQTSAAAPAVDNTIGAEAPVLNPIDLESGKQS